MNITHNLPERILHSIMFATLFIVIGYYSPKIYYEFFDKTEYVKVKQPIQIVEKKYYPCENVEYIIDRESLIDVDGIVIFELNFVMVGGVEENIFQFKKDVVIENGSKLFISSFPIPCSVHTGKYYFNGTLSYWINNVEKVIPIQSKHFEISTPDI